MHKIRLLGWYWLEKVDLLDLNAKTKKHPVEFNQKRTQITQYFLNKQFRKNSVHSLAIL